MKLIHHPVFTKKSPLIFTFKFFAFKLSLQKVTKILANLRKKVCEYNLWTQY